MPNTYSKYAPNVFLAKCGQMHERGASVTLESKYGKECEVIIFNLIYQRDTCYLPSYEEW